MHGRMSDTLAYHVNTIRSIKMCGDKINNTANNLSISNMTIKGNSISSVNCEVLHWVQVECNTTCNHWAQHVELFTILQLRQKYNHQENILLQCPQNIGDLPNLLYHTPDGENSFECLETRAIIISNDHEIYIQDSVLKPCAVDNLLRRVFLEGIPSMYSPSGVH